MSYDNTKNHCNENKNERYWIENEKKKNQETTLCLLCLACGDIKLRSILINYLILRHNSNSLGEYFSICIDLLLRIYMFFFLDLISIQSYPLRMRVLSSYPRNYSSLNVYSSSIASLFTYYYCLYIVFEFSIVVQ